jgi:ankyrin repeat protein
MTDSTLIAGIDGHKAVVRYLVEHGADVNAHGGQYGNPLQAAATYNAEIVRYLVEHGADVNSQGGEYGNPLQAASYWGSEIIVRIWSNMGLMSMPRVANVGIHFKLQQIRMRKSFNT